MRIFDKLVNEALNNRPDLNFSRTTVEKEILHHDILKILSENGFLTQLTFMGGTALRCCYNGQRLSEDLDFTGGKDFSKAELSEMGKILEKALFEKYEIPIKVREPKQDEGEVSTWKIVLETKPESKSAPAQHINIDICAFSSFDKELKMLQNHYGINLGTSGLILHVQSAEEIFTDKLIAFALRSNRPKYRDLWDIFWLHQQGYKPNLMLIPKKLNQRRVSWSDFIQKFEGRRKHVAINESCQNDFYEEMKRFIQIKTDDKLWQYLVQLMETQSYTLTDFLNGFIGVFPNLSENPSPILHLGDWQLCLDDICVEQLENLVTARFKNSNDDFIRIPFSLDVFYLPFARNNDLYIRRYIYECFCEDENIKKPLKVFIDSIYANVNPWHQMIHKKSIDIILDRRKVLMLRSSADKLYAAICLLSDGKEVSLCATGDAEYPHRLEIMYL